MSRAREGPGVRGRRGVDAGLSAARRRRAVVLVAGCAIVLLLVVAIGAACEDAADQSVLSTVAARLLAEEEVDADALSSALSVLDDFALDAESALQVFQEEALSLSGRGELLCDIDAGLVGFVVEGDAEDAFSQVEAELLGKGWEFVESGLEGAGTFVKAEGAYSWLYVSCVQVGDFTSVVVQVASFDEG